MLLSEFDYKYPEELVAQRPLERRDASRMMFIDRGTKSFKHSKILELPNYLREGDLLVVNNTKVFPARLFGEKDSGSKIEILLLKEVDSENLIWSAIATRKKRLKKGDSLHFDRNLSCQILDNRDEDVLIQFSTNKNFYEVIEQIGLPPLPPYIKRETREDYTDEDRERYQNVYAKHVGSAAAPTAGFHLTDEIIENCKTKDVDVANVTLHVGMDTFSPVRVENIKDHKMHGETFFVSEETFQKIDQTKKNGGRVVAVGTTTVRALESVAHVNNTTHLFITPGYKFRVVDAMLTNFHQPKSTLIMMVSAFAGREFILKMYEEAIKNKYRLFSYGDCMLIT